MNKNLTRNLTVLGSFVALVCIVFVVAEDVVHHGRSPADRRHDHVLEQAVEIYRDIDDRSGEAEALNEGRCTGPAVTSRRPRGVTGRP